MVTPICAQLPGGWTGCLAVHSGSGPPVVSLVVVLDDVSAPVVESSLVAVDGSLAVELEVVVAGGSVALACSVVLAVVAVVDVVVGASVVGGSVVGAGPVGLPPGPPVVAEAPGPSSLQAVRPDRRRETKRVGRIAAREHEAGADPTQFTSAWAAAGARERDQRRTRPRRLAALSIAQTRAQRPEAMSPRRIMQVLARRATRLCLSSTTSHSM